MQILEEAYLMGLEECKSYLHGRIMLVKRDKSLTHLDMLGLAWKSLDS